MGGLSLHLAAAAAGGGALALVLCLGRWARKRGGQRTTWLSARAAQLGPGTATATPAYIWEHIMRLGDAYCAAERPDGYICLAISENRLAPPLFAHELVLARPGGLESTGYDNPRGGLRFRLALANFLSTHVAERPVHHDALACSAGATGVLHNLLFAIADAGDVCLIPAPYFTGFDGDLGDLRVGIVPFAVPCPSLSDIDSGIRPAVLDAALEAAARQHPSGRVSVLLLTNPHNPTGLLYSESALSDAVEWASSRGLHVLVDEVYSNTVFCTSTGVGKEDKSCRKVTSVLQMYPELPAHVHVCWGMSKIFGIAGWRVGVLVSENTQVMDAFCSLLHPCEASTDTLHALAGVMEAPEFGHKFLLRLRQELQQAYMAVAGTCSHYSIPVITPQAGLYALLNLRAYLEGPGGLAEEEALWRDILAKTKVNLTPGRAMHCPEPGWFRLCFASQPPPALAAALRRLDDYFSTRSHEPRPRP